MIRALALVCITSAAAAASPLHVDARQCATLDPDQVDAAVARELALAPKLEDRARAIAISLECPDPLRATVRVEPDPADGPLSRPVDLGEVPPELRVKLVALAIVELVDVVDITPPPAPHLTIVDDEPPPRIVARKSTRHGPLITARAGLRLFADDQYPMAIISAEIELGPIELGLATSLGEGHRFTSVPYILAVTAARRLVCSDGGPILCMIARADAGFAGVSIYEDSLATMQHSVHSAYGDLALGFEVQRAFPAWKGIAEIQIGAAKGLVVEAQSFVHLNGPFAMAGVGARW